MKLFVFHSFSKSWLVFGVLLCAASLRAPFISVASLLNVISEDISSSGAMAGLLMTVPLFCFGLFSPMSSIFSNKYDLELTIILSMVLIIAGILIRSIGTLYNLFFGTGLLGLGIAFGNILLPNLLKNTVQVGLLS